MDDERVSEYRLFLPTEAPTNPHLQRQTLPSIAGRGEPRVSRVGRAVSYELSEADSGQVRWTALLLAYETSLYHRIDRGDALPPERSFASPNGFSIRHKGRVGPTHRRAFGDAELAPILMLAIGSDG